MGYETSKDENKIGVTEEFKIKTGIDGWRYWRDGKENDGRREEEGGQGISIKGEVEDNKILIDNNNGNDYKFGYNISGRDWKGPGGW
ncbi:unnamed protein product [Lathyrus oleraceus]